MPAAIEVVSIDIFPEGAWLCAVAAFAVNTIAKNNTVIPQKVRDLDIRSYSDDSSATADLRM
jgi:hypothetical protein